MTPRPPSIQLDYIPIPTSNAAAPKKTKGGKNKMKVKDGQGEVEQTKVYTAKPILILT